MILLLFAFGQLTAGEMIFNEPFADGNNRDMWQLPKPYCQILEDNKVLEIKNDREGDLQSVAAIFLPDVKKLAGKRIVMTGEIWREIQLPLKQYQGGKFQISYQTPKGWQWPEISLKYGKYDWKAYELIVDLPQDVIKIQVVLGIQNAHGTIRFRKLKLEATDTVFDFAPVVNMGFKDEKAHDGKGGWSDQGANNDAANFRYKKKIYADTPFRIVHPELNNEKSCLVFKSETFPNGVGKVDFDFSSGRNSGKYLYLLHTLTWGAKWDKEVGFIDLIGKNGKQETVTIMGLRDVADWWQPARRPNGYPAAFWTNHSSGTLGIYVSKFKINQDLGELKKTVFRSAEATPTWIVIAATLSDADYQPAIATYTVKADEKWKALNYVPTIQKNSALDLSFLNTGRTAGMDERIVVGKDGRFVFEKHPEIPIRFSAVSILGYPTFFSHNKYNAEFSSKKAIEEYADQLYRSGYNMVRLHYLDALLMRNAKEDFEFNSDVLDRLDYFFFQLKKRGIFVNLDAMCSRIGYSHGYSWSALPGDKRSFKLDIHFNEKVRENWFIGVKKLLTHKNPYTGKNLLEDPLLVMMVGFNEQEIGIGGAGGDVRQAHPHWLTFLRKRYKNIADLNTVWKTDFKSFSEIPAFSFGDIYNGGAKTADLSRFISDCETNTNQWYKNCLKKIGYQGLFANYNMTKSMRYSIIRDPDDYVAMNAYHAHPFNESIDTKSSIQSKARIIQGFTASKRYGKPLVVTEHLHVYWNPYRSEQGLLMGAYAAFQDFGGLTAFAHAVTVNPQDKHPINAFTICSDPIMKASEFLTTLIFRRGDVKTAPNRIRVLLNPEAIFNNGSANDALNAEEAALGLVTGLSLEVDSANKKILKNEWSLPGIGDSPILLQVANTAGWSQVIEKSSNKFRFDDEITKMKQKNFISAGNRSSYRNGIFETVTGEILLDVNKNALFVNTPRIQGVWAEGGTKVAFPEFKIRNMTLSGTLAAVSVDGNSPLKTANRIVLVYATNAMNTGDTFSDKTLRSRLKKGTTPILYECGAFTIELKNKNVKNMKVFVLGTDGSRISELPSKKLGDDKLELSINTANLPDGPAIYFELTGE